MITDDEYKLLKKIQKKGVLDCKRLTSEEVSMLNDLERRGLIVRQPIPLPIPMQKERMTVVDVIKEVAWWIEDLLFENDILAFFIGSSVFLLTMVHVIVMVSRFSN